MVSGKVGNRGFRRALLWCGILMAIVALGGCKRSGQQKYKYSDILDEPCMTAFNAINRDEAKVLEAQLRKGVDPDVRCWDQTSLLHAAAGMGKPKCARALIEYGADINIEGPEGTPLHEVARYYSELGHEVAAILIEGGANLEVQDADGLTPLERARLEGNVKVTHVIENAIESRKSSGDIAEEE